MSEGLCLALGADIAMSFEQRSRDESVFMLFSILTFSSHRESEPMVHFWRSSLHHCGLGHGGGNDSGAGLPVLGTGKTEVCIVDDLGLHGQFLSHHIPMVFLGLLARLLSFRHERLHRGLEALWIDVHLGSTQSR